MLRLFATWVLRWAAHTWSRFGHSWYICAVARPKQKNPI